MSTAKAIPFEKIAQDYSASGKESWEALNKCGNIWAKGMEDMVKTCTSLAQSATERNTQAMKSLLGCKTLNEFTEAQNKLAQENLDEFLSSMTKLSEMSVKVASEAFEPINDQISKSMKKANKAA